MLSFKLIKFQKVLSSKIFTEDKKVWKIYKGIVNRKK